MEEPMDWSSLNTEELISYATAAAVQIAGAAVILLLGMWLVKRLRKPIVTGLQRTRMDDTVTGFLADLATYAMYAVVVVGALSNLGIETTSFVALLGAAGFAVGLAMEGTLGNLASGVLIAVFRPFGVGDVIECADASGKVIDISIVATTLITLDNETIIVPNGEATSGVIVNYSREPYTRVEVPFKVGHAAASTTSSPC